MQTGTTSTGRGVQAYREVSCPCCHLEDSDTFAEGNQLDTFRSYQHLEGFEQLKYVRCCGCGLIYSNPRLVYSDSTLNDLFPDHVERRGKKYHDRQDFLRDQKATKVRMIQDLLDEPPGRFLEIGCGFGFALEAARDCGFKVVGTELYQGFIDSCRARGFDVLRGAVDQIPFEDRSCQVVFLDDVLEHLDQPFDYLDEANRVLEPGGLLFIHTWMVDEPTTVEVIFGPDWRKDLNLDLTAHTTIFPKNLLVEQLERRGFHCMRAVAKGHARRPVTAFQIQFTDLYLRKQA